MLLLHKWIGKYRQRWLEKCEHWWPGFCEKCETTEISTVAILQEHFVMPFVQQNM